jgi:hypothetical protein
MLLARDTGAERVLDALGEAIATGSPTAEMVRFYLYGQQMPEDGFKIEHTNLADYDRLIGEEVGGDG